MQFYTNTTPLSWFEFPLFSRYSTILHASYSRLYGTSKEPYDSLNIGKRGCDSKDSIKKNIQLIIDHFEERHKKISSSSLRYVDMDQVHGIELNIIHSIEEIEERKDQSYDAIATSLPNIILTVQHADCQPILLFDPHKKVIAAIHAGWRGISQKIASHVITRLEEVWGVNPSELIAGIGPSIGPHDMEFIEWQKELPLFLHPYIDRTHNTLNLWKASIDELISCGVMPHHITCTHLSTYKQNDLFFSYRKAQQTGRNATCIMLT